MRNVVLLLGLSGLSLMACSAVEDRSNESESSALGTSIGYCDNTRAADASCKDARAVLLAAATAAGPERLEIVKRALDWVDRGVPYNSDNAAPVVEDATHKYRSDASGFIAMAWHLPVIYAPSTSEYAPHGTSSSSDALSSLDALLPGDALNFTATSRNMMLFGGWTDASKKVAIVLHQMRGGSAPASYSLYPRDTLSGDFALSKFTPIRKRGLAAAPATSEGLRYAALATPKRIFDSRSKSAPVLGEVEVSFPDLPADAQAVGITVTSTEAVGLGFLTVYPCGEKLPTASNLNYKAGTNRANFAVAKLGANRKVCVYSNVKSHVIVDQAGSFVPGSERLFSRDPVRAYDSRVSPGKKIPAGTEVIVAGTQTTTDISTFVNVTVTEPSAPGFLAVYPCGRKPDTSNLNFDTNETVAGGVIAAGAAICAYSNVETHIIADLSDFMIPSSQYNESEHGVAAEVSYAPMAPVRAIDTRNNAPSSANVLEISVADATGISKDKLSLAALNLTVTESTGGGYVTAYACDAALPKTSSINFVAGQTIANFAGVKTSKDGKICIYRSNPSVQVIADINGAYLKK